MDLKTASCEEQYEKFPKLNRDEVNKMLEWQETQAHLPKVSESEAISFYHACDYDIERAKQCMDMYYTLRSHNSNIFDKRDVFGADVIARMKVSGIALMPGLTKEGYRVIICSLIDPDPSKFIYTDTVKFYSMVLDYWMSRDGTAEGYAIVFDMAGCTFSHLIKVNIGVMRKFYYYVQEALPIRLRAFHYINTPPFMDKLMAMMRPLINKELLNLFHLHKTLDTFVDKCIPRSMLPNEYGGRAGNFDKMIANVCEEIQANSQYFVEEEATKRVNEELRLGKQKNDRNLFGNLMTWFNGSKNND